MQFLPVKKVFYCSNYFDSKKTRNLLDPVLSPSCVLGLLPLLVGGRSMDDVGGRDKLEGGRDKLEDGRFLQEINVTIISN